MRASTRAWLRRIGLAVGALLVLLALFATWLLESESGAQFAAARAKSLLAGKLAIAQTEGRLAGPLHLRDVEYRDPAAGIDVSIGSVDIDYRFAGLLHRTLHVYALRAHDVRVALTTVAGNSAPPAPLRSLLAPPLDMLLDDVQLRGITLSRDGARVLVADRLDAALAWTGSGLALHGLQVHAPQGTLHADAMLDTAATLSGVAALSLDWRVTSADGSIRRVQADAGIAGDARTTRFSAVLNQPLRASIIGNVAPGADALPWQARLAVPVFDTSRLSPGAASHALGIDLQASGNTTSGDANGSVAFDGHHVLLEPLRWRRDADVVLIDALRLRAANAPGVVAASGRVDLNARPASAEARIEWHDVELPADLAGQDLHSHGTLQAHGSRDAWTAAGELALGPVGRMANIALQASGDADEIELHKLVLQQARGHLDAHGTLRLAPQLHWQIGASAQKYDPGALFADWSGALDFALESQGEWPDDGPRGTLVLDHLSGSLRQRSIAGKGRIAFAAPATLQGSLDLRSGDSTLALRASGKDDGRITAQFDIASLSDWLPHASGSVRGQMNAHGAWPHLDARGHAKATALGAGGMHAASATLDFDIHDLADPRGTFGFDAKRAALAGYAFDTLSAHLRGNRANHVLELRADGPQLAARLDINGALDANNDWKGTLTALQLAPQKAQAWRLQDPTPLAARHDGSLTLGELCLRNDAASACASARRDAAGAMRAQFAIARLPLASIASLSTPDATLQLHGEIDGSGDMTRAADGALHGTARLRSASGSIAYPDAAARPLLEYRQVELSADFGRQGGRLTLDAAIGNDGALHGKLALGAWQQGVAVLEGEVDARLDDIAFVDLLNTRTANTHGKFRAQLQIGGTSAAPALKGDLTLHDLATEIPDAGLKLHDGSLTVRASDAQRMVVQGRIGSANGELAIDGDVGLGKDAPFSVDIKGHDFLAADIPGARVRVSPDLRLRRNAEGFKLDGSVTIPKADVDLAKLPGGETAHASPDVVITDAQRAPGAAPTPLDADITVVLGAGKALDMDLRQGKEVHLVGFGLDGYLGGRLMVQQRPGRPPTARGQILVNGTYEAYGQDLSIDSGRLLFAGTPLENPGLDLRATRSFPDDQVTVGLQVRGTARMPVLTVFSTPAMEQSDALSYLVAGKPLSRLKGGEGNAVSSAARALGSAGGDLLAKRIGARTGIDDIGVADSTAVGGAALTIGKYLSPRLYLSYGIGLFTPGQIVTLRYRLTPHLNIELQNGTLSTRGGLNYQIEK